MTFWKKKGNKQRFKLTENDFLPWSLWGESKKFLYDLKKKDIIYQAKTILRILLWITVLGLSLYGLIKSLLLGGYK